MGTSNAWLFFLAGLTVATWGIGEFNFNLLTHLNEQAPKTFPPLTDSEIFLDLGLGTASSTLLFCFWIILVRRSPQQVWNRRVVVALLVCGMLVGIAYMGYQQLAKRVEASAMSPPISLYICLPIAYGVTTGESLGLMKVLGILGAMGAMVLFGLGADHDRDGPSETIFSSFSNALLLIVIIISYSFSSLTSGYASKYSTLADHCAIVGLYGVGICLVFFPAAIATSRGVFPTKFSASHALPFISGVCQGIGCYVDCLLVNHSGDISWCATLISLYTLIPTILGFVFLGDSVTVTKLAGVFVAMFALGCLVACKTGSGQPIPNSTATTLTGMVEKAPIMPDQDLPSETSGLANRQLASYIV
eukprot:c14533_g1_i2.p1 GENE.c14533_g1_i2~~c14533_g1_i2.p1  ORF type:complete len:370 (+),score=45.13 c14533_g1_i2:30-1112(+)